MWICPRCHTENRDADTACEACGAARAAGRFASPPQRPQQRISRPAQPPRVTAPSPLQETAEAPAAPARGGYQAPEFRASKPRRRRAPLLILSRWVGGILCLALPALTLLLAWRQRQTLFSVLTPLLLGPDAPAWQGWTAFGVLALTGALLSLLPGLWTLLLARRTQKE